MDADVTASEAAAYLGLTIIQVDDLRKRLDDVRNGDLGWGQIMIYVARRHVWRLNHMHSAPPTVYKVEE